jgi:hypothetical protein
MNVLRILEVAVEEAYKKQKISKKSYDELDAVIMTALGIHEDLVGTVKTKRDKY